MNLIGRIFTLLILLMSLCFLVVAVMVGASDRTWKATATEMKERAVQAERILEDAKANTTKLTKKLETEKASRAGQLAQLESQLKRAQADYNAKEKQYGDQIATAQELLRDLKEAHVRLTQQDKDLAGLEDANNKLTEDIAIQFGLVRNLKNDAYNKKNRIRDLSQNEADLVNQLSKVNKVMIKNGLNENSNTDHIPPKVQSVVTGTGTNGLFSVQLGLDDGLRKGHKVDVFRRGVGGGAARFIGTGEVVEVNDNMAVVREMKEMMADTVREGDHVATEQ